MSMFPIASQSPTTGSVTFANIPQTFTHLQIRAFGRSDRAVALDTWFIRFNSDTGTNYTLHYLQGNGTSATSIGYATGATTYGALGDNVPAASATSNVFGNLVVDILDYTNTSKYTTVKAIGGADLNGSGNTAIASSLWLNTAAVTSVTIGGLGNLVAGSRIDLYGLTTSSVTGA